MATHDYNLANQDGASFRSDLNNALAAIVSNNSSSTAPATTFAHQIWVDTTANVIKQRNAANDAWVELWRIDGGFNAKTFSSNVTLNAQSDLRFADSDSSNWVAFQAPATVSSNVTWTLPASDGTSGQVIETNGSGVLSWADAGGVQDNITEGNTSAEVVDTGSNGHFKVVTEGTEAVRVDPSQRLLVGTSTARANFNNSTDTTHIQVEGTAASTSSLSLVCNSTTNTVVSSVHLGKSDGSTIGSNGVVADNWNLGDIRFSGSDGTQFVEAARIEAEVDGTPGANDMPGRLVFATSADGASSPTERFRIASNGAWGLGGATYGTSGQVLTSQGSGSAPQWATPSSGKILQVVSTTKTDKATLTTTDTWTDISGMSASITPSSSSNKIFVQVMLNHGMDSSPGDAAFKLLRDSTDIAIGDADGSARRVTVGSQTRDFDEMKNSNISFLDSPATTSATTYKIQWMIRSGLFRLNSEGSSSNANISYDRGISTITLFEVAA